MAYGTGLQGPAHAAEPIAIVGVGCRLPGNVSSVDDLYEALSQGRDCITEIPPDRWDVETYYDPDPVAPGRSYVRHGGFVADIDRFDAGFFDISAAEASRMDPQQRMLLQAVWHALEDAGQSADELRQSNTGVFLAMMNTNDYSQLKRHFEGLPGITAYDAVGDAMSITAGRVAHFLGVEGPTFALDTACSGSMVALHLARQAILAGDCDTAIVAGVSAILHPGIYVAFSKVGLMSRSGRCRAFDAGADGYVRGEGCVAVVLRRQSEAIERGDHILASIVATAVNQDGKTPALTAPNGRAQERVIRTALARAGISPTEIGYVEAHGTGTQVGDPIEMSALNNVYGPGRAGDDPLYVGSAKTNFGHIESGAGLLGVVKAALALDRELIPPSLHFTRLNPSIDLGRAPIKVAATSVPWLRNGRPRFAGINSFGYSGTNAHTILQEAPSGDTDDRFASEDDGDTARSSELVVVSAKSAGSLQDLVDRWVERLGGDDPLPLADVAFTAAIGRTHLPHRLAVVGHSTEETRARLRSWREGRTPAGLAAGQAPAHRKPKVAFVFTGQGAQYAGMGRHLYESEQPFREAIDRCGEIMDADLGTPLREVLFGLSSATLLGNTRYAQPGLFAIEYALAQLLRHWGVEPDFVIGHSVGEIAAACVAGLLGLEDAARFVVARGRLMGSLPAGGKMLAVDGTLEQARDWIAGKEADVSIATVNGPNAIVISGQGETIDAVAEIAKVAGRRTRQLDVSHAFHSPLMDPILEELNAVAATMRAMPARVPIVSNLTGDFVDDVDIGETYWSDHVRQAVRFHEGMSALIDARASVLIEIGPHPALTPAIAGSFDLGKIRSVTTLRRGQDDLAQMLEALGSLYVEGVPVNLDRLFWSPSYRRLSLPLYPFRRDRHWLRGDRVLDLTAPTGESAKKPLAIKEDLHPLLGKVASVGSRRVVFETTLTASHPWTDHRVLGMTIFPGMAYLEMAARGFAAATGQDWRAVVLKDVVFERPIVLAYRKKKQVSLSLEGVAADGAGEATFTISGAGEGGRERYCRGKIVAASAEAERVSLATDLDPIKDSQLEIGPFYGGLREAGLEYGATFATVRELWLGKPESGVAIGRVTASQVDESAGSTPYANAVLLDGCLQVFGAALQAPDGVAFRGAFVPATIQVITLRRPLPGQVWSHVSVATHADGRAALATVRVLTDAGELIAEIDNLELRRTASLAPSADGAPQTEEVVILRGESRDKLLEQLRDVRQHERIGVVTKWLANEVKDTMGQSAEALDFDTLDPSTAFLEIGLDSLLVTELQRRIQEKLGFRFQPMQGLDYQSIESLAQFILDDVLAAGGATKGTTNGAVKEAEPVAVTAH